MKLTLAILFFVTAILYASVGFGGGSTYNALLVMSGADYRVIPIVALSCNIAVVSGNLVRYARQDQLNLTQLWPLVIFSVPMAWLGGRLVVPEAVFIALLCAALLLSGARLLWSTFASVSKPAAAQRTSKALNAIIGGFIGFYAGIVGIGGGIFLAPILYLMRWGTAKQIAAACSFFILANSIAGMAGQLAKLSELALLNLAVPYWPLIPAVILGGFIGNTLGIKILPERWIKRLTAILILYVAIRLGLQLPNL